VLDANVFIEAHKKHYAFDICPGYWTALLRQHGASRVCSIDKIRAELVDLHDGLSAWATDDVPGTFFKQTADKRVADAFAAMVKWAQNEQQFTAAAKAEFARVADGWLVSFAKVNGLVIVTHEQYAPETRSKVHIPNVCIEFDVDYCDTFTMLRELGEKFVSKKRHRRG
jgi:hypothetical protein